jgi:predicted SAM-dependent methyltransferase
VIVWDGAIEHFSTDQIKLVLKKCVDVLKPSAVLCGYTLIA